MMSILPRGLHYRSVAAGAALLTGIAVAGPARAQADRLVVADTFGGRAGWALETDDAFVLTSAGCMEMLTRIDHDGTVKPGLATSWTQTAATVWDFTLRAGVKFADGTPLDAAIAAAALNRTLRAAAPARSFSPRLVSEVSAPSEMTVRVTTPTPSVLVPLRMGGPNTGILSPNAFRGERINPVRAYTQIGGRARAHCVATGKAMLASRTRSALEQLARRLQSRTALTITDPGKFLLEMTRTRAQGCGINRGEWNINVAGIAAPIVDARGETIAAVGLSGPKERFKPARLKTFAPLVIDAAQTISVRLGAKRPLPVWR